MEPRFILIPSPLLGPATWEPAARALLRLGRRVSVPSLASVARAAPPYWPAGVDAIVRAAGDEPVALVPHSNSGLYMPAVTAVLGEQVQRVVFADAALPAVGYYSQRDFLNGLVGADGRLPPWTSWWDESDVAALFPGPDVRARVEAEQPRMPLAYYDHRPPAPDGWDRPGCAYLWFGEPYDSAAEAAAGYGWPTKHVPGNHLHMLAEPDAVASAVLELART